MRLLFGVVVGMVANGCRLNFDPATDATPGLADAAFDAAIDTPPGSVLATFGEALDATYRNVTTDTYLDGSVDTVDERVNNFGASDELRIRANGPERTLLRFDLSAIPATATILDARLRVTIITTAAGSISVHPLLEAWAEGNLDGTAGVANYTSRLAGLPWTTPGAGPGSSGDALGTFDSSAAGAVTVVLPTAIVAGWITAANDGLVLVSSSDDRTELASSEAAPASARPLLFVTYVP